MIDKETQTQTEKELEEGKVPDTLKQDKKIIENRYKEKMEKQKNDWEKKNRKQKITFFVSMIVLMISIVGLFLFLFARQVFGDAAGDKIFGQGVENGFVWIYDHYGAEVIGTLVTIFICFLIIFVANSIVNVFMKRSKKGRTVGSLMKSTIKYIAIIAAICIILAIWGVDVASIIAGLGVLTLVLGLGCQSLVNDIVSGIFIVFDDYFDVGDMVIIDGFRGNVVDIGLRTIKLNDGMGDMKAITNSSINTCVNLSRNPNMIYVTMSIGYGEDIEHVESIIAKELPVIKEALPQITDGPYYKGVDNINRDTIDLAFLCFCDAPNRFQVKRDLTRELYMMQMRNHICLPHTQIVVNPVEQEGKKATEEEKEEAKKLNDLNRAGSPKQKPMTFFETVISKTLDTEDNSK